MEQRAAAEMFSALGHEGRLAIFRLLVEAGPGGVPAGGVARALDVAPSSLSANLTILSQAGLIASRREGRSIIYSADFERIGGLLGFLVEDCCHGAPEVCAPLDSLLARVGNCG
jgi:DNA-binding transcriptional ArsR family regulator